MEETSFAQVEQQQLEKFREVADRRLSQHGISADLSMFSLTSGAGIDMTLLAKEGPMTVALWVTLLIVMRNYYKPENFKYPTIESFLETYEGKFIGESDQELANLWQTANWMIIMFTLIPARKNKGLVMQVIPKVVEGWDAKYVTGSGQTRFTANRVHVFEVEGNTRANHRGKHRMGSKKRHDPNNVSRSIQRNIAAEYKSPRRRKRGGRVGGVAKGMMHSKRARAEDDSSYDEDHDHDHDHDHEEHGLHMDETDGDEEDEEDGEGMFEESVEEVVVATNKEMVQAYTLFRDTSGLGSAGHLALRTNEEDSMMMDTSSGYGRGGVNEEIGMNWGLELIRSESLFNLKPSEDKASMQREVSWTEIPVAEGGNRQQGPGSDLGGNSQTSFGLFSPLDTTQNTFATNTPIPLSVPTIPTPSSYLPHQYQQPPYQQAHMIAYGDLVYSSGYGYGGYGNYYPVYPSQQQGQQQGQQPGQGQGYCNTASPHTPCTPAGGYGWSNDYNNNTNTTSEVLEPSMIDSLFPGYNHHNHNHNHNQTHQTYNQAYPLSPRPMNMNMNTMNMPMNMNCARWQGSSAVKL